MTTQSTDTHPEVERTLISLLRKKTTAQKFKLVQSFSSSILGLSKRAISRANPKLSEEEKNLLFIKYHYGSTLAKKLRFFIKKNKESGEIRDRQSG